MRTCAQQDWHSGAESATEESGPDPLFGRAKAGYSGGGPEWGSWVQRAEIIAWAVLCGICWGAPSFADGFRVSVGGGYGVGSDSGTYDVGHGTLDLQSVTGGSGPVLAAEVWADHLLPLPDLSLRVAFLRLMNGATANLDLPRGIGILTDPTGGRAKLSATANMGFLDAAFRPPLLDPSLAFYVGLGAGGGTGKASASFNIDNPALGGFAGASSVSAPVGAAHGFVGAEYHVTQSLFLAVEPQILYMTGHPVGIHQSYLDMLVLGTIGYSF